MKPHLQILQVPSETKSVRERVEEAAREIGVLLIVFAPLDTALNAAQGQQTGSVLLFALVGLCLFFGALFMATRRRERGKE